MSRAARARQSSDPNSDRLRLEFWPVDRLVPSARNARTHGDAQVAEIAGSIRAFGFTNPILVGEGGISSRVTAGWRQPAYWVSRRCL